MPLTLATRTELGTLIVNQSLTFYGIKLSRRSKEPVWIVKDVQIKKDRRETITELLAGGMR